MKYWSACEEPENHDMSAGKTQTVRPLGSCLAEKFKIQKLLHWMRILHVWNIKSRQNKKVIA